MKTKNLLTCILLLIVISANAQWTSITNSPAQGERVYFFNSQEGYCTKQNEIYKTVDGGVNWNNIPNNFTPFMSIQDIYFVSQDTGFVSIRDGISFAYPVSVYITTDGGLTWNSLLGPFNSGELNMHMAGQNNWYFHVTTPWSTPSGDTLYHTTNGGITWTNTGNSSAVQYNQAINNLVVYKDSTTVALTKLFYKSTDGGASWNLLLTDNTVSALFKDYQFINSNDGYVLLYQYDANDNIDSKIYKTTNGGLNWTNYTLPTACSAPQNMHFVDVNNGYIISTNTTSQKSEIWKTTDAGQTWTLDFSAATGEYFTEVTTGSLDVTGIWSYFGKLYVSGNTMITRFLPTTIKDVEQDKLNYVVFPNPSNGQLTIKTIAAEKNNFFTITDLGGKEVYTFKLEQRSATTIDTN
ncbi:MAG: hypothetical protein H0W73_17410 [Bacteroidetes bacterium]|nr:hypothetical protein [Bacteroidota bacterium]